MTGSPPSAINCLANMCTLSRADTNKIGRSRPSQYKELMPGDGDLSAILASALTTETLFSDDFEAFRDEHALMLAQVAAKLTA